MPKRPRLFFWPQSIYFLFNKQNPAQEEPLENLRDPTTQPPFLSEFKPPTAPDPDRPAPISDLLCAPMFRPSAVVACAVGHFDVPRERSVPSPTRWWKRTTPSCRRNPMACLNTLKQEIRTLEAVFAEGHERFQVVSASVDEISCRFIGKNGKKYEIHANITVSGCL